MKKTIIALVLCLFITQCQETNTGSNNSSTINKASTASENQTPENISITEIGTTQTENSVLNDYTKSSFSDFIYFHNSENKIIIDYDFFPEETDFDSQTKMATLSCLDSHDQENSEISININLSAPTDDIESCQAIELDLSSAQFTLEGLEFELEKEELNLFKKDFQIAISKSGFVNSDSGKLISSDLESRLEDMI